MPGIDFAAVRRAIPIARVLGLLEFEPAQRHGEQLRGPCPLHGCKSDRSRSFSVNLAKNAFRCFVCGAAGNQLDLWRLRTQLSLFDATVDLCNRLQVSLPTCRAASKSLPEGGQRRGTRAPPDS